MTSRLFHVAIVTVLTFLSGSSQGQSWEVFDVDNSPITSTTVNSVLDDQQGGVWVGTDWGLCHFDGDAQWDVFQTGESGIPENFIKALAMDTVGDIWVGFQSAGLAKWDAT